MIVSLDSIKDQSDMHGDIYQTLLKQNSRRMWKCFPYKDCHSYAGNMGLNPAVCVITHK